MGVAVKNGENHELRMKRTRTGIGWGTVGVVLTGDSQFLPDFTPCLCGITLKSLQQGRHLCLAVLLCHANGIRLVDIPWFPEIYLSSRGNPTLDDVKVAIISSTPEWSASILGGLVHFHPGILQHLTNTGGVSIASKIKGGLSTYVLHIDIYVRMCQEYWNHGGSTASKLGAIRWTPVHPPPCSP